MTTPEWIQYILLAGSVAAALVGVGALVVKIVKGIRKIVKSCRWIVDSIQKLLEHSEENHMDILRLTVMRFGTLQIKNGYYFPTVRILRSTL